MTIKKKLLSAVLSLVMALQVGAIALPVYAEEGTDAEPISLEAKLEQIRIDTNLITNGDFEDEVTVENAPTPGRYGLLNSDYASVAIEYEVSEKESYSRNKSLFQSKTNGGENRIIGSTDNFRKGATYIASAMVLGSEANADHWNNNTLKDNSTYQPKMSLKIDPMGMVEGILTWFNKDTDEHKKEVDLTEVKGLSFFPAGDFIKGTAHSDENGERASKEDWKQLKNKIVVKETSEKVTSLGVSVNVGLQCSGQNPNYNYMELYTDDYYLGELMVADVHINDIAEIALPEQGEEEVELVATAVNQLGTSEWLGECEYEWEIIGDDHGVSIDGNILTVPADAKGGKITLEVTCTPDFTGAETQSGEILEYRKKTTEVNLKKLTEEEREEAFLKGLNLIENGDLESELFSFTGASGGYGFVGNSSTIARSVSDKESYSGKKSLFQSKTDGDIGFIAAWQKGNVQTGRTYIASVMALGTVANSPHWNNNSLKDNTQYQPKLFLEVAALKSGNTAYDKVSGEFSEREVKFPIGDFLTGAANDDPDGEKSVEDDWTRLINVVEVEETASTITSLGLGVRMSLQNSGLKEEKDKYLELYTDDYYLGELIVYNVENTTEEDSVVLPAGKNEKAEIELKAEAYNQLGTQDGLENSTFKWEIVEKDKKGLTIEDNKLVVTSYASAGDVTLKGTCEPGFKGADEQTDSIKKRREVTVTITIKPFAGATEEPQAKDIKLTGSVKLDEILTLSYKYWQLYNVAEGDTEIVWYRSENANGPWEAFNEGNLTYKLEEEGEDDLFYRAEVKPVSEDEIEGAVAKTETLCKPVAPVASNVKVKGIQAIDEVWEVASYDYYDKNNDAEDEPLYQWFVSATDKIEDGTEIEGATEKTYKITENEAGKYVYVGVKAVSKVAPEVAEKFAYSEPRLTSAVPSVSGVKIEKESSNLVKVKYNYSHPLKIAEGESVIEWYNGNELLGKGTSLNISKLKGEKIEVRVTPMAEKKPYAGETKTADYEISYGSASAGGSSVTSGGVSVKPVKPEVKPTEIQNVPSWAKAEIDYVLENKIMEVASENDFAGNNKINRGEFMMAMLKAAGITPSDYRGSFADVTSLDKFSGYLQSAFDQGVISAADNFYPARELTRDEMCKIIVTSIEAMTKKEISKSAITHFTDYSNIQAWAIDYISQAVATGIIVGNADGSVNPKGNVTRAEAAVVAKRIVEYVKAEGGLK